VAAVVSARELVAGEVCMFEVIEWVKGKARDAAPLLKVAVAEEEEHVQEEEEGDEEEVVQEVMAVKEAKEVARVVKAVRTMALDPPLLTYTGPSIQHGEAITDRKSVFVGHLARVRSKEEVREVLDELLSDKKIAKAAHNIVAWRVTDESTGGTEQVQQLPASVYLCLPLSASVCLCLPLSSFICLCLPLSAYV
jgi:hypothetical protein